MINVNQITSMLAKMPDAALQKYAAMNKNDPYIMALAVSESNRRKEMRAGAQAQQGQMQQPKVADQAVASMAAPMPEDQGIAALPAGEMNFADGGIVAFADRGLVVDPYAYENPFAVMPSGARQDELRKKAAATEFVSTNPDVLRRAQFKQMNNQPLTAEEITALSQANTGAVFTPGGESGLRPVVPGQEEATAEPAAKNKAATPGIGAPRASGFSDYASAKAGLADLYKTPESFNQYEQARKDQAGAGVGIAQEAADRTKDFYDKLGEFGLKQEERLKEREGKLEKDTAQNKGLAILEAGLAMMSGTSANAFENISKGAMSGVANYKKGLAALNERKDRLDDAYNQLETARYSDKKDRFQQIEAAQKNVDAAKLGIYQATTDIAAKRTDLDSKQATALADATVKSVEAQRDRQSRESIAAAPGDTQKMYMALGGGDLKKGFEVAKQMEAANKKDIMTQYTEWLKANPTLAMDSNKAMAEFMKQSLIMGGIGAPPLSSKPTGQVEGKLK